MAKHPTFKYLDPADFAKNVMPGAKKSNQIPTKTATAVETALKALDANITKALKTFKAKDAEAFHKQLPPTRKAIVSLQAVCNAHQSQPECDAISAHCKKMLAEIDKLKTDWNKFINSLSTADYGAYPAFKAEAEEAIKGSFSSENTAFIAASNQVGAGQVDKMHKLFQTYIRTNAPSQINIASSTRKSATVYGDMILRNVSKDKRKPVNDVEAKAACKSLHGMLGGMRKTCETLIRDNVKEVRHWMTF